MDGGWRGDSGSDCRVTGGEPQRGPGQRADTLLQDTGRHDGEVIAASRRAKRKKKRVRGVTHARKLTPSLISFLFLFIFIFVCFVRVIVLFTKRTVKK